MSEITDKPEVPRVCPVCLSNAQHRRWLNSDGKSVEDHYRDLVQEAKHDFPVLKELPRVENSNV